MATLLSPLSSSCRRTGGDHADDHEGDDQHDDHHLHPGRGGALAELGRRLALRLLLGAHGAATSGPPVDRVGPGRVPSSSRFRPGPGPAARRASPGRGALHPKVPPMAGLGRHRRGGWRRVATASALIMRGLAGRVTIYSRDGDAAPGSRSTSCTPSRCSPASRSAASASTSRRGGHPRHHRRPPHDAGREPARHPAAEHRVMDESRPRSRRARCPDRARRDQPARRDDRVPHPPLGGPAGRGRWARAPRSTRSGSPTAIARECRVHPRSVHAWVVGEHGDSCVFLLEHRGGRHAAARSSSPPSAASTSRPSGSRRSSATSATRRTRSAISRAPRCRASGSR